MFVCVHEIKVLLAQAQRSEWFAYIQDLKGFHQKMKEKCIITQLSKKRKKNKIKWGGSLIE